MQKRQERGSEGQENEWKSATAVGSRAGKGFSKMSQRTGKGEAPRCHMDSEKATFCSQAGPLVEGGIRTTPTNKPLDPNLPCLQEMQG